MNRSVSPQVSVEVKGIGAWFDALDAWEPHVDMLPQPDWTQSNVAAASVKEMEEKGFEALAVYRPHDGSSPWGSIEILSEPMDRLIHRLVLKLQSSALPELACGRLAGKWALGMVLSHELFHARVQSLLDAHCQPHALALYQAMRQPEQAPREFTVSLGPHHQLADEGALHLLRSAPLGWLEEALANWVASEWLVREDWCVLRHLLHHLSYSRLAIRNALRAIQDELLDKCPSGYRDWRLGGLRESWLFFTARALLGGPSTDCGFALARIDPAAFCLDSGPRLEMGPLRVSISGKGHFAAALA